MTASGRRSNARWPVRVPRRKWRLPAAPIKNSSTAPEAPLAVSPARNRKRLRSGLDDGIEHTDFLPVVLVLVDELLVPLGILVGVVRLPVLEHHVQGHVPVRV